MVRLHVCSFYSLFKYYNTRSFTFQIMASLKTHFYRKRHKNWSKETKQQPFSAISGSGTDLQPPTIYYLEYLSKKPTCSTRSPHTHTHWHSTDVLSELQEKDTNRKFINEKKQTQTERERGTPRKTSPAAHLCIPATCRNKGEEEVAVVVVVGWGGRYLSNSTKHYPKDLIGYFDFRFSFLVLGRFN